MSTNKNQTLINIASQELDLPKVTHKLTEVERFIRANNIQSGNTEIQAMRIYILYWKWKDKRYLSVSQFFKEFKNYFKSKSNEYGKVYMLNPTPFDMSKEGWWEYRKQLRKYRYVNEQKKRKEKNPKK